MGYNLQRVKAPVLGGWALRCCAALLENPITRPLLLPSLLKHSGLNEFRRFVPEGTPLLYPLVDPTDGAGEPTETTELAADAMAAWSDSGRARRPTVRDYEEAYRSGAVTPEDVASRVLESVEASNQLSPPLGGMIKWDRDDVLRQARESADRYAQGTPRSVLEGVPVAIKDEVDLLPYTTSVGTRFLGRRPPSEDSTVVARLRAAGAMLIGKANMYEIGIAPLGSNPIYGFARNPYNTAYDPGGSSSGCGAVVGAGIVPLAIGADGGGSVRIPAALCGITGLMPTFGRISGFGSASLCWSVGNLGPLGATALDTAIGYAVCAGRDPRDNQTQRQPPVHLHDFDNMDLQGVTLGICESWFEDADEDVVASCEATMKELERMGARRQSVIVNGLQESRMAHAVTILSEMASSMESHYEEHRREFAHPTRVNLVLGRRFTGADYLRAQRYRSQSLADWQRVLSEVDVVMTPTTACTAPYLKPGSERYGESDLSTVSRLMQYCIPGNLCGMPSVSFPSGYDSGGLPIGMQSIGRHWDEHLLLRVAHAAEQVTEFRQPAVSFDVLNG